MTKMLLLTPGEPAGIAPEISAAAWLALGGQVPFCLIGDAGYFASRGGSYQRVENLDQAAEVFTKAIPVLHRPLPAYCEAGRLNPRNSAIISKLNWVRLAALKL